jgi:hypothetical protein
VSVWLAANHGDVVIKADVSGKNIDLLILPETGDGKPLNYFSDWSMIKEIEMLGDCALWSGMSFRKIAELDTVLASAQLLEQIINYTNFLY